MQAPTLQELQSLLAILPSLPDAEKRKVFSQLEQYERIAEQEKAKTNFMEFVHKVWPSFISGRHHAKMARAFERVARGNLKRLIINMPPRHTKSEFASYLLPAWFLGNYPGKKVIQTSHTAELAVGFGRKVRNLVDQDVYTTVFPGVGLQADSKSFIPSANGQDGSGFVLSGFGATETLLASISLINPSTGTTFYLNTTTNLIAASGFTLSGNKTRLVVTTANSHMLFMVKERISVKWILNRLFQ